MDCFLYDRDLRHDRVKDNSNGFSCGRPKIKMLSEFYTFLEKAFAFVCHSNPAWHSLLIFFLSGFAIIPKVRRSFSLYV